MFKLKPTSFIIDEIYICLNWNPGFPTVCNNINIMNDLLVFGDVKLENIFKNLSLSTTKKQTQTMLG